jgi:S-methylmethionine transporter
LGLCYLYFWWRYGRRGAARVEAVSEEAPVSVAEDPAVEEPIGGGGR